MTKLTLNGAPRTTEAAKETLLLYVLRNDFQLNGPKYGCGLGECGACTVLIDGAAARACVIPLSMVEGRSVVTLEGLARDGQLHPVQQAFVSEQGTQCGYCLNGMVMTLVAFLEKSPERSESEIRQALRYQLCRCGAHVEIMNAALKAAEIMKAKQNA